MTIRQRVENILRVSQKARDSDKELLIIYMQKSGMELTKKQEEIFKKMPSVETVRRIRQKLQEEGKYPASDKVDAERFKKFQAMRSEMGRPDASPEDYLERNNYKVLPWGV